MPKKHASTEVLSSSKKKKLFTKENVEQSQNKELK